MPNQYNSAFTGAHNDEYDERITTLNNTKVNRSGDTMTGPLTVPSSLTVLPQNNVSEGGEILLKGVTNTYPDVYIDSYQDFFRICDSSSEKLKVSLSNGNTTIPNGLLRVTKNNNTVTIGSQNEGWCHIYNSADIPFIFNRKVYSTGYIGNYINATRNAVFTVYNGPNTSSGCLSALSVRTPSGSWCINTYTSEQLQFTYGTNTNFNNGTNTTVTAKITAAGAFTNASKREYKENILTFNLSGLNIINSIQICSFNMKGDPEKDYRVGFIADDTDPIVSGKNQDVMDVQNCIGVLIKAVQELDQKVKTLENKIKALQE